MAAYVIFCLQDVADQAELQRYRMEGRGTLAAHGARFIAGSAIAETLEGPALEGAVVLEFDNVEAARAWYHSPEYQAVIGIRLAATKGLAFIVDGR
jgi:uncharacterized protein (DUF1330 family)